MCCVSFFLSLRAALAPEPHRVWDCFFGFCGSSSGPDEAKPMKQSRRSKAAEAKPHTTGQSDTPPQTLPPNNRATKPRSPPLDPATTTGSESPVPQISVFGSPDSPSANLKRPSARKDRAICLHIALKHPATTPLAPRLGPLTASLHTRHV